MRANGKGYTITSDGKRFASLMWMLDEQVSAKDVPITPDYPVPVNVRDQDNNIRGLARRDEVPGLQRTTTVLRCARNDIATPDTAGTTASAATPPVMLVKAGIQ